MIYNRLKSQCKQFQNILNRIELLLFVYLQQILLPLRLHYESHYHLFQPQYLLSFLQSYQALFPYKNVNNGHSLRKVQFKLQ